MRRRVNCLFSVKYKVGTDDGATVGADVGTDVGDAAGPRVGPEVGDLNFKAKVGCFHIES